MRFEEMSPHLRFLSDAAHLLSQSAPETSAFLMSRRNEVLVENGIPISDAQRQHACNACGHIMIPGQGDTLKIQTDKITSHSKAKKSSGPHKTTAKSFPKPAAHPRAMPKGVSKVIRCGKCSTKTVIKVEGPSRISRSQKSSHLAKEKGPQTAGEPVNLANANSKKRAKNRKAGLQALLDQKQGSASSSGFGLSLSDFIKKRDLTGKVSRGLGY